MTNSGNTNGSEDTLLNEVHKKVSVLQELYIELFATLIPGFMMTLSILVLLFLFHFFTYEQLLFSTVLSEHLNPWIGFVSILVISYTFGAILYRRDPNEPDKIASYIQWRKASIKEKKRLAVQYPLYQCKKKCPSCKLTNIQTSITPPHESRNSKFTIKRMFTKEKFCNLKRLLYFPCFFDFIILNLFPQWVVPSGSFDGYPYRYLRQYLFKRGLYHLLIFVPWCPYVSQENTLRSKNIINELKTVIKSGKNGHYMLDLLRNEGHIRMLTSMWYVMRYLIWITLILFVLGIIIRNHFPEYNVVKVVKNIAINAVVKVDETNIQKITFQDSDIIEIKKNAKLNNKFDNSSFAGIPHKYCACIAAGFLIFWFWWGKRSIEKSIHYVRIREIVTVLEQAYHIKTSSSKNPFWKIINMRNKEFTNRANSLCVRLKCKKVCSEYCCKKSSIAQSLSSLKKGQHKKMSIQYNNNLAFTVVNHFH